MTPWRYVDGDYRVVSRTLEDGSSESCLATREDVQAAIAAGEVLPPPPPAPDLTALAQAREDRIAKRLAKTQPLTALLRKAGLE